MARANAIIREELNLSGSRSLLKYLGRSVRINNRATPDTDREGAAQPKGVQRNRCRKVFCRSVWE